MFGNALTPRYKLIMRYNVRGSSQNLYFTYVTREFVPALAQLGLHFTAAWHTAYGPYPMRQLDFVAASLDEIQEALEQPRFIELEERLRGYTYDYERKIVAYRATFQF